MVMTTARQPHVPTVLAPTEASGAALVLAPRSPVAPKLSAAPLLLLAALAASIAGQGAYYRRGATVVAILLVAALVTATAGVGRPAAWRRPTAITAALTAIGLWAAVSGILGGRLRSALPTIALVGAVAAAATVARRATTLERDQVATGLIVLGGAAAGSGWLGVVLRASPWAHPDAGLWRAATSVTYANAAAALLAAIALLALARVVIRPSAASRLAAFVLIVGLGATLSRAGIAGFLLGATVLALLLGRRTATWRALRPAVGAAVAVAGLLPTMPVASPNRPVYAVVGLVLGLILAVAPIAERRVLGALAAALPVAIVVLAAAQPHLGSSVSGRTSLASPDRAGETHAALALVRSHPIAGVGAGAAVFIWSTPDHRLVFDHYAHDEYLQVAAEQGVIGLGLLAVLGLVVVRSARRGRPELGGDAVVSGHPLDRGDPAAALWAGAVAALVAVAVHSGFDFLWHVPAVAVVAAVLIGLASATPAASAGSPVPTNHKEAS
ncbi:MAG: O-antigen ligase family protein [Actinomycetota bacterium]|nr:O-antigen ligase family protein [Actinomycetota bacterium]